MRSTQLLQHRAALGMLGLFDAARCYSRYCGSLTCKVLA